ncbi:MAG: DUF3987 domain-containing protein [Christensenellaceae bacterium]|jgi:ATP-dependent DNA helicase RecG|nr:DUF3987 domain-containing protein [Christensenellaceae bacterium]
MDITDFRYKTVDEFLDAPECENFQLKEAKFRFSFTETLRICCALSNCGGGELVLGITDKRPRRVVGSLAFLQPERIREKLIDELEINVDFKVFDYEGLRVLAFHASPRPERSVVKVDGVAWYYRADSLLKMSDQLCYLTCQDDYDFSSRFRGNLTMSDMSEDAIRNYRNLLISNTHDEQNKTLSNEQILRKSGVLTNNGYTNAALILFGTRVAVAKYFRYVPVVYEYRNTEEPGPAAVHKDFIEGFFNYFDEIWRLVNLHNTRITNQDGSHSENGNNFDYQVIREALLNAVTHRSYNIHGSIIICQYNDRITFLSPGGFPTGVSSTNIITQHVPRNNLIANVFLLCGLVERVGAGIDMIYRNALRAGKELPDFSKSSELNIVLTLQAKVVNPYMQTIIKKIDENTQRNMKIDDYAVLSELVMGNISLDESNEKRFTHLLEIGVWKQINYLIPNLDPAIDNHFQLLETKIFQSQTTFENNNLAMSTFPVSALPHAVSTICEEISILYGVPLEFPSAIALGYLSTCCQKRAIVRRANMLLNSLNLFVFAISDTPTANRNIFTLLRDPIISIQNKHIESNITSFDTKQLHYKIFKQLIAVAYKSIPRAKSNTTIRDRIVSLEMQLKDLIATFPEKLLESYTTSESLSEIFEQFPNITIDCPNGTLFENFNGSIPLVSHLNNYSSAYNSIQSSTHINLRKSPCISLVSACSSETALKILGNKSLQNSKLLSNFNFAYCISKRQTDPSSNPEIKEATVEAYANFISELLCNIFNADANHSELVLTNEAARLTLDYIQKTTSQYDGEYKSKFIGNLCSDFREQMIRIAGILAICDDKNEIDAETINRAIKISDWFVGSAFNIYLKTDHLF